MSSGIPAKFSPWPSFTAEEAEAVARVLLSNKVNYWSGVEGKSFEREFAEFSSCKHALALANGTVALELALKVLGIGKGDEVIVTSRTFIASVSSIVNVGASPVFADVDSNSQNITAESIHAVLSSRTKAIICVHLAGWPCEMDEIMALADRNDLWVIEDCAQAHGARYRGRPVGSLGHIAAWSFCQDKIMTTGGEGGMLTTSSRQFWEKAWAYKDHGKSWELVQKSSTGNGFRWLHESFGTNWRMTEMQAAIGRIQLKRMEDWHASRARNANLIGDTCRRYSKFLRIPEVPEHIEHAWYKFYVFVRNDVLPEGWTRERIVETIVQLGVPCFTGSCSEVYLEKAFDGTDLRPQGRLPNARRLGEESMMFLVHPTLSEQDLSRTCSAIETVMNEIASVIPE